MGPISESAGVLGEDVRRLASLARDPARLARLTDEQRAQVNSVLRRAHSDERGSKFYRMFPRSGRYRRELYPKQMEHFRAGRLHRERCLMGGNRTGKTVSGGYETTCHTTGEYPDWWEGKTFDEPIAAWACGKQNETVRDIVQAELFGDAKLGLCGVVKDEKNRNQIQGIGMIPASRVVPDTAVYRGGYPRLLDTIGIRYRDSADEYSTLGFKAYEQGRGAFEGTARSWIWLDEEPPFDVYGECLIRTGTVGGLIVLTFTPLDGLTETVIQFLPEELRPSVAAGEDEFTEY